jgi:hypothetical protein
MRWVRASFDIRFTSNVHYAANKKRRAGPIEDRPFAVFTTIHYALSDKLHRRCFPPPHGASPLPVPPSQAVPLPPAFALTSTLLTDQLGKNDIVVALISQIENFEYALVRPTAAFPAEGIVTGKLQGPLNPNPLT